MVGGLGRVGIGRENVDGMRGGAPCDPMWRCATQHMTGCMYPCGLCLLLDINIYTYTHRWAAGGRRRTWRRTASQC